MRTALMAVLCLLMHQTAMLAQPAVGPEILSDPLPIRKPVLLAEGPTVTFATPAVAAAIDHKSVAIAWTMPDASGVNSIYVGRLDATGHLTGAVQKLPKSPGDGALTDANTPSMAASPAGLGFTVAWLEVPVKEGIGAARSVFCQLDLDLNSSAPRVLASLRPDSPVLVRSNTSTTWLSTDSSLWQLHSDGSLTGPVLAGIPASDIAVAGESPQLVSIQRRNDLGITCTGLPGCPPPIPQRWTPPICPGPSQCASRTYSYDLKFGAPSTGFSSISFNSGSDAQAAVQSDGHDVLVARMDGYQSAGGQVKGSRLKIASYESQAQGLIWGLALGTFGPDAGPTRPDIATDGERYVVVWRTTAHTGDHDIVGASLDRAGTVTPFSIATSTADERDPSIVYVGGGTFLVTYERFSDGERRIAGRFLRLERRRRATN